MIREFFYRVLQSWCVFTNKGVAFEFHRQARILNCRSFVNKCKRGGVSVGNSSLRNCRIIVRGNDCKVMIGNGCHLRNVTFWFEGEGSSIIIGDNVDFTGTIQLAACEGKSIKIGDGCLFSHDIFVRTTDSHPIFNDEGERVNCAQDVSIGSHVWVGMQSLIMKGAIIAEKCVVGARSMVTQKSPTESGIVLGGQPAKKLKAKINWRKDL